MAKKIGITILLCFSLSVFGVSASAAEITKQGYKESHFEMQPQMSSIILQQKGTEIYQSSNKGKSWKKYVNPTEPTYFTYDEFKSWIRHETKEIQKLVDAGEWTQSYADKVRKQYYTILDDISNGLMVSKRSNSDKAQIMASLPPNRTTNQYQTILFDGNNYRNFGPFNTQKELLYALKDYADAEIKSGTMTPEEASNLLENYQ